MAPAASVRTNIDLSPILIIIPTTTHPILRDPEQVRADFSNLRFGAPAHQARIEKGDCPHQWDFGCAQD
jgi:hypothetical protein